MRWNQLRPDICWNAGDAERIEHVNPLPSTPNPTEQPVKAKSSALVEYAEARDPLQARWDGHVAREPICATVCDYFLKVEAF